MINYSKQGKASKRKGYYGEKKTAEEITQALGGSAKPTPRSGGFSMDFKGDIMCNDNVAERFLIEVKKYKDWSGLTKLKNWLNKARSESTGDNYLFIFRPDRDTPTVTMDWEIFLRLLEELQGYIDNNKEE